MPTSPYLSKALAGGLLGAGGSEVENRELLTDMSPEMKRINNIIGAVTGTLLGTHGIKSMPGAAALGGWPIKTMAMLGTGTGQKFVGGQQELMDKKLMAAILDSQTAERKHKYMGMNDIPAMLTSLAAVGGAGGLAYYLHKKYGKKKKKPGSTTVRGTANSRRNKVRIDVPASSLPKEFFTSLVNADDKKHSRMRVPDKLLKAASEDDQCAAVVGFAVMKNASEMLDSSSYQVAGPQSLIPEEVEGEVEGEGGELDAANQQLQQAQNDATQAQQQAQTDQQQVQHDAQMKELEAEQSLGVVNQQLQVKDEEIKAKDQQVKALEKEMASKDKAQSSEMDAVKSEHDAAMSAGDQATAATMSSMLERMTTKLDAIKGDAKIASFSGFIKLSGGDAAKIDEYVKTLEAKNKGPTQGQSDFMNSMNPAQKAYMYGRVDPMNLKGNRNAPPRWHGTWQESIGNLITQLLGPKVQPTETFPLGGLNQSVGSQIASGFGRGMTGGMPQFNMLTPGHGYS